MKSMKKFVAALLLLTMVLALASTAFATKEEEYYKYVKFTGSAYGYEKVTNNYGKNKSSVALRKGSIAYVVAKKGDWYKIWIHGRGKNDDEALWFNKKYVKELKEYADTKLIYSSGGSGRSHEWYVDSGFSFAKKAVKTSSKVNLRKSASLAGKSQGVVKKGQKVTLTGKAGVDCRGIVFFEVKYNGKKGFISAESLKGVSKYAAQVLEYYYDYYEDD